MNAQTQLPAFGTARVKPKRIVDEEVVGIFEEGNTVIEDDADKSGSANNIFTPVLTQQLLKCCVNYSVTGVKVSGGERNGARVSGEIARLLKKLPPFENGQVGVLKKAQRALRPEGIALGVFGALVHANLVAAVPGRLAARTPMALLLRNE